MSQVALSFREGLVLDKSEAHWLSLTARSCFAPTALPSLPGIELVGQLAVSFNSHPCRNLPCRALPCQSIADATMLIAL